MSEKSVKTTKKGIGTGVIFFITLNAIFASSLTYLPGLGVQILGAKSIIAWFIVFGIGIYIAMALAELVSMFPKAGDLYVYAKNAYGHFIAFIVGWTSWLAGNISASLAVVWALEYFYPIATLEAYLIKLAIGIGIIILLNYLVFRGLKLSKAIMVILSLLTISVITLQITPLFFNVHLGSVVSSGAIKNFMHVFATSKPITGLFLFATVFIISEAFMGMEIITFLSEDAKSAKTIPKAIISAMVVASILTLIYLVGSIGIFPIGEYATSAIPHKAILDILWQGTLAKQILFFGTALMIITPALVWIFIGPNLLRSLGRDKLILEQFTRLHKKFKTPTQSIIFQTIIISLFTTFMYFLYIIHHHDPYKLIHEVFLLLILTVLSFTLITIPIFRKKIKNVKRPFKLPLGKVGPFIIVGIFITMVAAFLKLTGEFHLIFKTITLIGLGIPVYFILVIFYNPEALRKMNNRFSKVSVLFEEYNLPKKIRKKIINSFNDVTGKTVIDFNASIGTLTLDLAKKVGPLGKVISVDISKENIKLINKRVLKRNYKNIETIHDEHLISRLHPSIKHADAVFSVGSLDYIQNLHVVLKDIANILPDNGQICFVEFSELFGFIPNSSWSSNLDNLKKEFRKGGFSVRIGKWKGVFWNYIYIYGIKSDKEIIII